MFLKQELKAKGFFVYQDEQGRDIYYDFLRKKGYYLRAEHLKMLSFYQNRFWILLAGAILAYNFFTSSLLALGIFYFGFLLVWEYAFRHRYLPKLQQVEGFVPNKKQSYWERMVKEDDEKLLILRSVLYTLLGILLPLNALYGNFEKILVYIAFVLGALALLNAGLYLWVLFKKKKNPPLVEVSKKKKKRK